MIKDFIIKIVQIFVRFVSAIGPYSRDIIHMARGYHKVIRAEHQGRLGGGGYSRAVVVAVYPNDNTLPFTLNLLKGFAEANFFVLVVSTKILSQEMVGQISPYCHHIIERFNIGMDFGSYQAGLRWIEQDVRLQNIDMLAIANDSMFYPASITYTIRNVLAMKGDWNGLFENFETHYHLQSFFEVFRASVFKSDVFRNFWRQYTPLSWRVHAINKGEVGLSLSLVDAGFVPAALYDSEYIRETVAARLSSDGDNSDLIKILSLTRMKTRAGKPEEVITIAGGMLPQRSVVYELSSQIGAAAERQNPTHCLGLLCNFLFEAPVKCDLAYRGMASIADILSSVRGFTPRELAAMKQFLRNKGVPASTPRLSWRGLKVASGAA